MGALWAGGHRRRPQWSLLPLPQDGISSGASYRRYKSGYVAPDPGRHGGRHRRGDLRAVRPRRCGHRHQRCVPGGVSGGDRLYAGDDMRVAAGTTLLSTAGADVNVTTGINQDVVYFATTWAPDGASGATEEADMSRGGDGRRPTSGRPQPGTSTTPIRRRSTRATAHCTAPYPATARRAS